MPKPLYRQILFVLSVPAALMLALIYITLNTAPNPNGPNPPVWLLKSLRGTCLVPILLYAVWHLEEARRYLSPRCSRLWHRSLGRLAESESIVRDAS